MGIHFGKFIHTETGKIIMSILLGFGLASLFRRVCKDKECLHFYAPSLDKIENKIYNSSGKCVKYIPVSSKCDPAVKTVLFR